MEKILPKKDRVMFNNLQNKSSVLEFLEERYDMRPSDRFRSTELTKCNFDSSYMLHKKKYINYWEDDASSDFLGNLFEAT